MVQQKQGIRWLIGLLFLILAITFFWCIVDNIILGAQPPGVANGSPATAVTIIGAILWLIGHGFHGAAVIALPVIIWRRSCAKERNVIEG